MSDTSPWGQFPFMDADEFRRKFPDQVKDPYKMLNSESPDTEMTWDTTKTPVMIVEEFSVKSFKQIGTATYIENEAYNATTGITTFVCHAKMMKFEGTGRARTKKNAKHLACYELIKCAINMDRYKEFYIPAKSKEEALKLLDQIKPVDDLPSGGESQTAAPPVENWIGKLNDFCIQNKLSPAVFEYTDSGKDNAKIFTVSATVGTSTGRANGKKKKEAKAAAAHELLKILQPQVASLKKASDQLEGKCEDLGAEEDNEPIEGLLGTPGVNVSRAATEVEPQKTLESILKDTRIFLPNYIIHYNMLEQPSTLGRSQMLLTVKYTKAPPQPIVHPDGTITTPKYDKDDRHVYNYVFSGEGEDEKTARNAAARTALVHFLTYKGPKEATPTPNSAE